jgi:tetratricopeptide (TPR) repeat protein
MSQISHAISNAFTAFDQRNWTQTEWWGRQVLQYEGFRQDVLVLVGAACYQQGKLTEAIAWYREALALDPNYAEAYKNLGVAALDLGEIDTALAQFEAAVVLDPHDAQSRYNLGNAFWANGQIPEAIRLYEIALDLQPDYPAAQNNLATILQSIGQEQPALRLYRKTLQQSPNNLTARINLANLLQTQGNHDGAMVHYQKALALNPAHPDLAYNLARNYEGLGNAPAAIETYYLALKRQPNHAPSHSALGMLLRSSDLSRATAHLQQAISYSPEVALYYDQIGQLWLEQDALPSAIASFRQAIQLEPELAEAHLHLARALFRAGEWRSGFAEYEWRWKAEAFLQTQLPRHLALAPWQGEDLTGKRLLVWTEQGDGEALVGLRLLSRFLLSAMTAVVVECAESQVEWFRVMPGVAVVVRGGEIPACDFQVAILSLGDRLGLGELPPLPEGMAKDGVEVAEWAFLAIGG